MEILIVIVVVMLVMGGIVLPQIGDSLGRAIRNFKRGVQGENEIDVTPIQEARRVGPKHDLRIIGVYRAHQAHLPHRGPSSGLDRSGDDWTPRIVSVNPALEVEAELGRDGTDGSEQYDLR